MTRSFVFCLFVFEMYKIWDQLIMIIVSDAS